MLITLSAYAKMHGKNPESARKKAARGGFETARKNGRTWLIDSEEPYDDLRRAERPAPEEGQLSFAMPQTTAAAAPGFCAALFDELDSIYPDTDVTAGKTAYTVAGCNGTYVGVQIAVSGLTPGIPLSIDVEGPHRAYKLFEMIPVPVEVNTGARMRSELLKDDYNENVIRRAPFYVYEVLKPLYRICRPQYTTAAFVFRTPIEYCREEETYTFTITLNHGGASQKLVLETKRYPAVVKPATKDDPQFVNWLSFDQIALQHNAPMWSNRYAEMLYRYLRAARYTRQNIFPVPVGLVFDIVDGEPRLNIDHIDYLINISKRAGIERFQGQAFCTRASNLADNDEFYNSLDHDSFTSPEEIGLAFKKRAFDEFDYGTDAIFSLTGVSVSTEEGQRQLKSAVCQLYAYMKMRGLCDVWQQCCLDEPNDALKEVYHIISRITRDAMPNIPILEPVLPTEVVIGDLDIWCPSIEIYEGNKAFFDARVAAGDQIYVYTCLTPGGNYLNRLLDQERLRAVYIAWNMMRYPDIIGYLHWGLNQNCSGDLFDRSASMFSEQVLEYHPKYANFLPAGDQCIFYPGYEQPLITTRSEAHRIGFEDLALLRQLKEKDPAHADAIVAKVYRRTDEYEKSVEVYRAVREELLKAASGK